MAVAFQYLDRMVALGLLAPGRRVLDIGCSNLYGATCENVARFMAHFDVCDESAAHRIAQASAAKTAFIGELLERCGLGYAALDMAPGHRTKIFNLNQDRLPKDFRGAFDLVLNFGTTEHVLAQAHAFGVIHDAAKPGGLIYHQLPAAGYTDHGYFLYTGRFFFDLAGHNGYEVVTCAFNQGDGRSALSTPVRTYAQVFPALAETRPCAGDSLPDVTMDVIYRKRTNRAFRLPLDFSTSATPPRPSVTRRALGILHYLRHGSTTELSNSSRE